MKILLLICYCFFSLTAAFAQYAGNKKTDTIKVTSVRERSIASTRGNSPLWILDNIQISDSLSNPENALKGINPNDILSIDVLKDSVGTRPYGKSGKNGVIIVTTIAYAKSTYQNHIAAFSKKYAEFLQLHQNNDDNLVYILDGTALQDKQNDIVIKLYNILKEKILQVGFDEGKSGNGVAKVFINTTAKLDNLK